MHARACWRAPRCRPSSRRATPAAPCPPSTSASRCTTLRARRSSAFSAISVRDVVEAAYRIDCEDQVWLKSILEAMRPNVEDSLELVGYTYHLAAPSGALFGALATVNMSVERARGIRDQAAQQFQQDFQRVLGTQQCSTVSEASPRELYSLYRKYK
jgi:hypothetical protein